MKIPNYDRRQKVKTNKKLCDFIDEDYRMLIIGQSLCGKTNTLMHMVRTPLMFFDKIYMYTPNTHQEKIQDLKTLMDKISEKVGYPVLEIGSAYDIKDTSEYSYNNRKVITFDDLINASEKVQNKITLQMVGIIRYLRYIYPKVAMMCLSRYDLIALICCYTPQTTTNHLNIIAKENLIDPGLFNNLGLYEFLFCFCWKREEDDQEKF